MRVIRLINPKAMNRLVSHNPGVRAAVKAEGDAIALRAEARLAAHRDSGSHSIDVDHSGRTDSVVLLKGPAPLSVEFGHDSGDTHVEGLYILLRSAGLI